MNDQPNELREQIADICRTGNYEIAETKVIEALTNLITTQLRAQLDRLEAKQGWFDESKDKSPKMKLHKVIPLSALTHEREQL